MHLYRNPWYFIHGLMIIGFEAGLYLGADCNCAVHLAVDQPRLPTPIQPDSWNVVSVLQEPASITSALGTTARPGTGELTVTGYDPAVLVRPVEVVASSLS